MTIRQIDVMAIRGRGFSMIDVLVAIVVLATGLLALAALQGALTRNGADARARSQIAAYTESVLDRMRFAGYDAVVPGTITSGQTITAASTCTDGATALTLVNRLKSDAKCAQDAAGASNLQTKITGTQYWGSGGTFTTIAPTNTAGVANYKQVNVTTTWTDASGQSRTLSFDTTVSGVTVNPTDNSLDTKQFSLSYGNAPVVREVSPAATAGVIPIAVSGSQNAAATNPAPLVSNKGVTFTTLTYDSTASTFGGNQITQRIDTKALQCTCQFIASGGVVSADSNLTSVLQQPYGPTYWDGTKYVSPAKQSNKSQSTTGVPSTSSTNDSECDICCRDRNDPTGDGVLFDNYTGNYDKYQYVSGALTKVTSGTFTQVCRMIRVNGVYATATDVRNSYFGIIDTESCATAGTSNSPTGCTSSSNETSAVPSSSAETAYQNFVKDYLFNSFSSYSGGSGDFYSPSDPLAGTTVAPTTVWTGYSLNTPSSISINASSDTRYMHARGLFVDHLESKAVTAFHNAISGCSASDETTLIQTCGVLSVLPFTTVNMTELAVWTVSPSTGVLNVSTNAALNSNYVTPSRGSVSVSSGAANNATANAVATVAMSTTGLTALTANAAFNPVDASNSLGDQRAFQVTGGSSGSGGSGGNTVYFDLALKNLSWLDALSSNATLTTTVDWNATVQQWGGTSAIPSTGDNCGTTSTTVYCTRGYPVYQTGQTPAWYFESTPVTTGNGSKQTTTYYPLTGSSTSATPVGITVTVQNFNNYDNGGTETVTCTLNGTSTGLTYTASPTTSGGTTGGATRCYNYDPDVANITITHTSSGTPSTVSSATMALLYGTTDGGQKEGRVITIPTPSSAGVGLLSTSTNTIAGADLITIPFVAQSPSYNIATGQCTCSTSTCVSKSGKSNKSYSPGTCSN